MLPTNGTLPARVNILGVGISAIDMDEALCRSENLIRERRKGYICITGVHGIMEAQGDPVMRGILNRSFLSTPDGMPTVWVGRMQGHRNIRRVYGPDFMLELCRRSVPQEFRHFLYGGRPGVAEKLQHRLTQAVPGIRIVGRFTPPFRPLTSEEEQKLTATIHAANADIVWVGLSTPKQEKFMAHMIDRLDVRLMVGVGAAFDMHAGLLADAPAWIKVCGLQWLHRLALEPRRLWRRYLRNNPRFLWSIALQAAGMKTFSLTPSNSGSEASTD